MSKLDKKKVLVIAMLDSIHTARWISQFKEENIVFYFFPSKKFRNVHPDLLKLFVQNPKQFKIRKYGLPIKFFGYLDFAFTKISSMTLQKTSRSHRLNRTIIKVSPNIIHAIEIQGAGYLIGKIKNMKNFEFEESKVILTNFGSDISYFQQFEKHRLLISDALESADYYSAECERDYKLALEFGFRGKFLPCLPNAGGFSFTKINNLLDFENRNLILVKGYGGEFGKAKVVVDLLPEILNDFPYLKVHLYSVTDDLIESILELKREFPHSITFSTVRNSLQYHEMKKLFLAAKVYIGLSQSDGISTSFLESIVNGAYPIQSNTSCIDEWGSKGYIFSAVSLDSSTVNSEIRLVLNGKIKNDFQSNNFKLALQELNSKRISDLAKSFYEI